MKVMTQLAILFYFTIILVVGFFLLAFSLHWIDLNEVIIMTQAFYMDQQLRVVLGSSAALILLMNYISYEAIVLKKQREKTIAFDNPAGRVTVSLTAMEDLIRRVILKMPEIKEVRASMAAGKKGLAVNIKLVLKGEANIPELTAQLQDLVKRKILDTVGLEEAVIVRIDVVKIVPDDNKSQRKIEKKDDFEPTVPFQGYRA
jgi:uncharacterized alkaline shock family protein YloU